MLYLTNGTAGLFWIRAFAYMCYSIAACILPGQAKGNGERGGQNAKEGSGRIAVDKGFLEEWGGALDTVSELKTLWIEGLKHASAILWRRSREGLRDSPCRSGIEILESFGLKHATLEALF